MLYHQLTRVAIFNFSHQRGRALERRRRRVLRSLRGRFGDYSSAVLSELLDEAKARKRRMIADVIASALAAFDDNDDDDEKNVIGSNSGAAAGASAVWARSPGTPARRGRKN